MNLLTFFGEIYVINKKKIFTTFKHLWHALFNLNELSENDVRLIIYINGANRNKKKNKYLRSKTT